MADPRRRQALFAAAAAQRRSVGAQATAVPRCIRGENRSATVGSDMSTLSVPNCRITWDPDVGAAYVPEWPVPPPARDAPVISVSSRRIIAQGAGITNMLTTDGCVPGCTTLERPEAAVERLIAPWVHECQPARWRAGDCSRTDLVLPKLLELVS